MSSAERIASAIVLVALVTTVSLPGRMFPQVIGAFGQASSSVLSTAMGTAKGQG